MARKVRSKIRFMVPILIMAFFLLSQSSSVTAASSPTISNATVQDQKTNLSLPSGATLYLYGLATGGAASTSTFANGEYAAVEDADGYLIAGIAETTSNTNSFTTGTNYHNIGGASISSYSKFADSYGFNGAAAAPSASDTFTVTTAGSLVVVIALAGGEQCQTLSGIPNLRRCFSWRQAR